MGDVVNLNKARKAKRRAEARTDAAANRAKFGRTGAEEAVDRASADRSNKARPGDGDGRGRERGVDVLHDRRDERNRCGP